MFRGPNMIVCVLLVSNSRGFCFTAPGDHDATIFPTATNTLLIKSNSKFESRATAFSVAMSPRNFGGKYGSRLHPRSRKCACQFFGGRPESCEIELRQAGVICFPWRQRSWSSSTQLWYIRASAGRYVFRWDRLLDEGFAFVQAGTPSCPDDVTLRSCANVKCDVADVNK